MALTKVKGHIIADDLALGGNPTTSTQSTGNNTTRLATTAFVQTELSALVDSAPSALNTLNELAAALGDNANFSTTVNASIAAKLPLAGGTLTGSVNIGSYQGSAVNSPLDIKSDSNHFAISIEENSGTETWQLGVNANGDLNFYDSGATTPIVTFSDSNNIGIGEVDPDNKLDVNFNITGEGSQEGGIKIHNVRGTNNDIAPLYFGVHGGTRRTKAAIGLKREGSYGIGSLIFALDSNGDDANVTFANDEKMRIDSSGNVGIGTNNPTTNLDVYNASGWGTIHIDGTSGGELAFQKAGTRYGGLYASNSHGLVVEAAGGTNTMLFLTNSTTRMVIDSSGNVGIDESTPLAKLHVVGGRANGTVYNTIIAAGGVNSTDGSGARLVLSGCENDPLARGTVIEGISTGTGNSHKLHFKTNNGSNTPSTRMTIGHTGNVGIGYDSPARKLQIAEATNYSPPGLGSNGGHVGIFKIDSGIPKYGMITGVSSSGKVWQQVQRIDGTATAYNLQLQPSGGNIEIGTNTNMGFAGQTSPGTPIHVGTSTSTGPRIQISHEDNGGFGALDIDAYGTATFRVLSNFSGSTMNGVRNQAFALGTPHNYPVILNTNGLERIRIGGDGSFSVGTSPATSFLIVNAAGDTGLGTASPYHSKKKKVEITVTTAITSNASSTAAGNNGGYDVSNDDSTVAWGNLKAMTVAGVYNKPVLELRIVGNMAANTWYPIATMSQLTDWQNDTGANEYNGFSMYFRIYTYDTGAGGGEYLGSRMSERIWVNAYTCNSTQRHNLHVGAAWGHAPNNGQTAAGSGPYQLSIKHHYNTDSYYPAIQTLEFKTTAAKTGLTGTSNKNITIYGYVG